MINKNILDDNLDNIDKSFVRTKRIQQVEIVAIVGCIILLVLQILHIVALINLILNMGMTGFNILIGFAMNLWVLAALIWWRSVSIEYDINTNLQRIELPHLLKIARIWIPIYGILTLLSSWAAIRFLFTTLDREVFDNIDTFFLSTLFSFVMAILDIYYWWITKKSMEFINKIQIR